MITCAFEDGGKASLRHIVVECLVVRGGDILLVKRAASLLEGGKWALPGGYMNRDETLLEGVRREVLEETGFTVNDLTLFRVINHPHRPRERERQNIAFVYFCQANAKEGEADWESDEQKWFKLDDFPSKEEAAFDHFDTVELYLQYLKKPFDLPVLK